MKKRIQFLIAGIVSAVIPFCSACESVENKTVELLDFTSFEKEVKLGSLYSLPPAIVVDKEGKDYKVEYVIENELAEVQVNNNQFVIENLKDYVITCNVSVGKEKVVTRTITLNVKDENAPIITLGTITPGFVGIEYTIPAIVTDDSGEIKSTDYTVEYVNGEEQISVPVQDGKFTPTQIGEYKITVSAMDMQANKAEDTFSMYVRTPILTNEVLSFSTPSDVTNVKAYGGENANTEYLSNFAGEQGVVKLGYNNTWPYLQFKPLREMTDYADYDQIVFKMYFPKAGEYANADGNYVKYMKFGNNTSDDLLPENVVKEFSADMYDKWVELVFDAEKFKEYWTDDMQFSMSGTAPRLWGNSTSGGEVTAGNYYLADISVRKSLNISSDEIVVSEGVATVPTLTVSTKSGRELTANEDYTVTSRVTYDYGVPDGYQTNDKTFVASEAGVTYTVTYEVEYEGFTYVFIKSLTISREYAENEVISFDYRADVEKVTVNGTTSTKTWLDSYEGEKGVLKASYTGAWPSLYFVPNQDMSKYASATKIVFRMYISNSGINPIKALVLGNRTGKDVTINLTAEQYNTWMDFEFDIEVFKEYWKTDGTINHYYASFWMYTNSTSETTDSSFYIAGIWVE